MKRYEHILFDADDTLFDYKKAEEYALRALLQHLGCTYHPDIQAAYHIINQKLWAAYESTSISLAQLQEQRFAQLCESPLLQSQLLQSSLVCKKTHSEEMRLSLARENNDFYTNALGDGAFLLDGALEICRYLVASCKLSIVTNGISHTQRKRIAASELKKYISSLFISGEIGAQKPQSAFFDVVFSSLGIHDKSSVLIVGDRLSSDIAGGNGVGIDTCWYNPQSLKNDSTITAIYEISNLVQLKDIVTVP